MIQAPAEGGPVDPAMLLQQQATSEGPAISMDSKGEQPADFAVLGQEAAVRPATIQVESGGRTREVRRSTVIGLGIAALGLAMHGAGMAVFNAAPSVGISLMGAGGAMNAGGGMVAGMHGAGRSH